MITLETSAKHALLLDSALRRTVPGTSKHAFLQRLGRSLDQFGSLTPAMQEAVTTIITARSNLRWACKRQANGLAKILAMPGPRSDETQWCKSNIPGSSPAILIEIGQTSVARF